MMEVQKWQQTDALTIWSELPHLSLQNAFIEEQVAAVREQIGDKKVLLALSGGVDSSVSSSAFD